MATSTRIVQLKCKELMQQNPHCSTLSNHTWMTTCSLTTKKFLAEKGRTITEPMDPQDVLRLKALMEKQVKRSSGFTISPNVATPERPGGGGGATTLPPWKIEAVNIVKTELAEIYNQGSLTRDEYTQTVLAIVRDFTQQVQQAEELFLDSPDPDGHHGQGAVLLPDAQLHPAHRDQLREAARDIAHSYGGGSTPTPTAPGERGESQTILLDVDSSGGGDGGGALDSSEMLGSPVPNMPHQSPASTTGGRNNGASHATATAAATTPRRFAEEMRDAKNYVQANLVTPRSERLERKQRLLLEVVEMESHISELQREMRGKLLEIKMLEGL